MLQRVCVIAMGVIFLVAIFHNPGRAGATVYAILQLIAGGTGAALAARQVWLQSLPKDQVPACGMSLDYMLETLPFTETLSKVLRRQRRMRGERLGVPAPFDRRLDAGVLRGHCRRHLRRSMRRD